MSDGFLILVLFYADISHQLKHFGVLRVQICRFQSQFFTLLYAYVKEEELFRIVVYHLRFILILLIPTLGLLNPVIMGISCLFIGIWGRNRCLWLVSDYLDIDCFKAPLTFTLLLLFFRKYQQLYGKNLSPQFMHSIFFCILIFLNSPMMFLAFG